MEITLNDSSFPEVDAKAKAAKTAAQRLATVGTGIKNAALSAMADALDANRRDIIVANSRDIGDRKSVV